MKRNVADVKEEKLIETEVSDAPKLSDRVESEQQPEKKKLKDVDKEQKPRELKAEDINKWKKEYKKIYKSKIGDDTFIWRKLKRHEYVNIKSQTYGEVITPAMASMMVEEDMVKTCILFPFDIEDVIEDNAGIASSLSDVIMEKSGFTIRTNSEEL